MHVLIADSFEQSGIDALNALGIDVTINPQLSGAALAEAVASLQPEVLVVRGTKVPADVLAAGALALVVRAGAGYNTIDVAAASRRGIYVSNCPGKNAIAVAELTFGLILALDRRIVRQRARPARGPLEQGGVLGGQRAVRAHARPRRRRRDRLGDDPASPRASA